MVCPCRVGAHDPIARSPRCSFSLFVVCEGLAAIAENCVDVIGRRGEARVCAGREAAGPLVHWARLLPPGHC
eukprot:scaffold237609_cov32-Tisochrysis_lutea.AAC.3